jgi:hypothetical protein
VLGVPYGTQNTGRKQARNNLFCRSKLRAESAATGTGTGSSVAGNGTGYEKLIGTGTTCIAVVRFEDATLANLTEMAIEILGSSNVPAGSVFMLGSASHLFRVGAASYATDWVNQINKLELKFKNINFCPLAPILREASPGSLVQDLETITVWYHMVYGSKIKGMLTCWDGVVHFAQHVASDPATVNHEVLLKIPLPQDLKSTVTAPTMIRLCSSDPAILPGMGGTIAKEVLNILLSSLQKDFSIAIGPEITLQWPANGSEDMNLKKSLVCIGSSILKQLVPYFQAAGYTVSDLTQPGWIATEENIQSLIKKMSQLSLEPGFAVILDLVGNCAYRYCQFDGTQALPYKEGGRFHFAGPVTLCGDETFKKIIKMLSPVLLSAQNAVKVIIPPLPRHLFSTCCSVSTHCTNFGEENYTDQLLGGVTRLRNVLKKDCTTIGMSKKWVLDGVGAILGTPAGESYGTNREILSDLRPVMANDGVHLEQMGSVNLSKAIISAVEQL